MTAKNRRLLWIISICICVLLPITLLALSVGVHRGSGENSCTSVVLDRIAVRNADRILIYEGDEVFIVTDTETVRELASQFVVADRTDGKEGYSDLRLEIYSGSKLVRNVQISESGSYAKIYDANLTHWVFSSNTKEGQRTLTPELLQLISNAKE